MGLRPTTFCFSTEHQPGRLNIAADFLSRLTDSEGPMAMETDKENGNKRTTVTETTQVGLTLRREVCDRAVNMPRHENTEERREKGNLPGQAWMGEKDAANPGGRNAAPQTINTMGWRSQGSGESGTAMANPADRRGRFKGCRQGSQGQSQRGKLGEDLGGTQRDAMKEGLTLGLERGPWQLTCGDREMKWLQHPR